MVVLLQEIVGNCRSSRLTVATADVGFIAQPPLEHCAWWSARCPSWWAPRRKIHAFRCWCSPAAFQGAIPAPGFRAWPRPQSSAHKGREAAARYSARMSVSTPYGGPTRSVRAPGSTKLPAIVRVVGKLVLSVVERINQRPFAVAIDIEHVDPAPLDHPVGRLQGHLQLVALAHRRAWLPGLRLSSRLTQGRQQAPSPVCSSLRSTRPRDYPQDSASHALCPAATRTCSAMSTPLSRSARPVKSTQSLRTGYCEVAEHPGL